MANLWFFTKNHDTYFLSLLAACAPISVTLPFGSGRANHHNEVPMPAHRRTCLLLLLILCAAPACRPQAAPADQAPKPSQEPDCAGYFGWGGHTGWGGAYDISTGCLTVANGSVQFHTGGDYQTTLFDFPITELAELQSKKFKFWKGFQLKLKSGKKWDFYAFYDKDTQGPDGAAAVVEKAIRDLAAQHSVLLK